MKKTEAIIFDWAGTTVDYGCFAPVKAFISAFKEYKITPTVEEVRKPMGIAKRDHVKAMLEMPRIAAEWERLYGRPVEEKDVDAIYERSEELIFEVLPEYSAPKPYVCETVQKLRDAGIKIGSTTGYNDEMMAIVTEKAAEQGYAPDCWFSPNSTGFVGRPYPFMIFNNLQTLKVSSVSAAIKVGDTVADILEGKNAGMKTVGIIEGSSLMAFSEEEFNALTEEDKAKERDRVFKVYKECGADYIINDIRGLCDIVLSKWGE